MSGGISIHCVDVANGRVAAGLKVSLRRLVADPDAPAAPPLAAGRVGTNGLFEHPALLSPAITSGGYEVTFAVGDFYREAATGLTLPEPMFLEDVPYRFNIAVASQHYHLPFKFTPWGFSLFRGGA